MDRGAWWAAVHGVAEPDTTVHCYQDCCHSTTTAVAVADVPTLCQVVKPNSRDAMLTCLVTHLLTHLASSCCVTAVWSVCCWSTVWALGLGPSYLTHPTSVQLTRPFSSHMFDFWTPFQQSCCYWSDAESFSVFLPVASPQVISLFPKGLNRAIKFMIYKCFSRLPPKLHTCISNSLLSSLQLRCSVQITLCCKCGS